MSKAPKKFKPRSRGGFTQNADNVWGHCEEPVRPAGRTLDCMNQTLYRCDRCGWFVCADHQKRHLEKEHPGAAHPPAPPPPGRGIIRLKP